MTDVTEQRRVLMYHGIVTEWTAVPKERENGAELYDVTLGNFKQQMQLLHEMGFKAVQIDEDFSKGEDKQVVLTFDDGEMNNYEHALPVLKKYNFPAYFFIIAERVGNQGYMGWEEIRLMREAGMVVGSHGFSHEILTSLMDTQLEEELRASKRYLERNLNIEIDTLSIPRGFCNDNVIQKAYAAGYKHVFISDRPRRLESDCYSRTAVRSHWSKARFSQAVHGVVPFTESMAVLCKSAIKRVFGGSLYDWVRKTILYVK